MEVGTKLSSDAHTEKSRRPSLVMALGVGSSGEETTAGTTQPECDAASLPYGMRRSKFRATQALAIGRSATDNRSHESDQQDVEQDHSSVSCSPSAAAAPTASANAKQPARYMTSQTFVAAPSQCSANVSAPVSWIASDLVITASQARGGIRR